MPENLAPDSLRQLFQQAHGLRLEDRDRSWNDAEIEAVDKVLGILPEAFVSGNPNLKAIVRQQQYTGDYAGAPGGGMYQDTAGPNAKKDYLVIYDQGMYDEAGNIDLGRLANTLIHELAHSLDDELSEPYRRWLDLSKWFLDNERWLPARDTGFVSAYAQTHPKEDFAESFTLYVVNPERLENVSPMKYNFMRALFHGGM